MRDSTGDRTGHWVSGNVVRAESIAHPFDERAQAVKNRHRSQEPQGGGMEVRSKAYTYHTAVKWVERKIGRISAAGKPDI